MSNINYNTLLEDVNLSSFVPHEELNSKIWIDGKLNPKVDKILKQIAKDFYESLEVNADLVDVQFLGSLTNYNWSKFSDIDLHLLLDFTQFEDTMNPDGLYDSKEFVANYFNDKKAIWNELHNIKIYGFDVEIYIQPADQINHSGGVYSLMKNEWIKVPEKEEFKVNLDDVKKKTEYFIDVIDKLDNKDNVQKSVEKLKDKLKKMRQAGLDSEGEFSVDNLVYKALRREGYLDKLFDLANTDYDDSKTLNEGVEGKSYLRIEQFKSIIKRSQKGDILIKYNKKIGDLIVYVKLDKNIWYRIETINDWVKDSSFSIVKDRGNGLINATELFDTQIKDDVFLKLYELVYSKATEIGANIDFPSISEVSDLLELEPAFLNEGVSKFQRMFEVKLKNSRKVKRGSNSRDYVAVYVDIYDNGDHVIKSWSSNDGRLMEFKKEAKKYNEKKIGHLNKVFPKYKFSKITDTYVVKPKIVD